VIELGMNHPGETAYLINIAKPTIALINNAQREHQEFMETVDAVAHEHADAIAALPVDGIAVFPNPASEQVQILLKDLNSETDISVYSSAGKLVYSVFGNQNDLIAIQTDTWHAGIYLVQITDEKNDLIFQQKIFID
jgi:UDP-N-acetylmuramyl pentapeptide synthase